MVAFKPSIQSGAEVSEDVAAFLKPPRKMLIGNEWRDSISGATFDVFNAATGGVLSKVARAEAEDVDLAVKAARAAFDRSPWRKTTPAERARLLWKLADLIESNLENLVQLESLNQGMNLATAKFGNVGLAAKTLRFMAGLARGNHGITPEASPARPELKIFPYTLKEPIGVAGQIIPWNFPLLMAAWKIGPALAAGCTVVLKPAEQTPLTALRLGELALEAGFPEGVLNIVPGFGEQAGAALASHKGVDKIAFTGSTAVGRKIIQAAASNLKKVTLELGGKSANIVYPDADLSQTIPGLVSAITLNQGQVCFAGSRLYVHRNIFDEVMRGLAGEFSKLKMGHGFEADTQIGPLVSRDQVKRVESYLEIGKNEGAQLHFGGTPVKREGYFVQPTIFSAPTNSLRLVQEEIFGPVLSVLSFSTAEEAISLANDTDYGLAAGVWTRDLSLAHQTAHSLKAGTVWINGYNILDLTMPFGGYRQSGWGRELGFNALDPYCEEKSVIIKL